MIGHTYFWIRDEAEGILIISKMSSESLNFEKSKFNLEVPQKINHFLSKFRYYPYLARFLQWEWGNPGLAGPFIKDQWRGRHSQQIARKFGASLWGDRTPNPPSHRWIGDSGGTVSSRVTKNSAAIVGVSRVKKSGFGLRGEEANRFRGRAGYQGIGVGAEWAKSSKILIYFWKIFFIIFIHS